MTEDRAAAPASARKMNPRIVRGVLVGILVVACLVAYALTLKRFDVQEEPREQTFGVEHAKAAIDVYLQALQVDTTNGWMDMRLSILPLTGGGGIEATDAKRDMKLLVHHDARTDELLIRKGQSLPEITFRLYLQRGSVRDYPLDRYTSFVRLEAHDANQEDATIHLTIWEGILGFSVRSKELENSEPSDLELSLDVQRSGAFAFFAFVAYAAIVILALSALAIGSIVFIGLRAIEGALVGAVASVVFALFGLRQALPSSPPLGIRADVLVFFWAELAAALSLCLLLIAWASRGNRPPHNR